MRKVSRATLKTDHLSCFAIWIFFIILFLKTPLYFVFYFYFFHLFLLVGG